MTTLERAARAAFDAVQADGAGFRDPWDQPSMERVRQTYMVAVRAALLAIREPSEEMRAAGADVGEWGDSLPRQTRPYAASDVFCAMIDAALSEG